MRRLITMIAKICSWTTLQASIQCWVIATDTKLSLWQCFIFNDNFQQSWSCLPPRFCWIFLIKLILWGRRNTLPCIFTCPSASKHMGVTFTHLCSSWQLPSKARPSPDTYTLALPSKPHSLGKIWWLTFPEVDLWVTLKGGSFNFIPVATTIQII